MSKSLDCPVCGHEETRVADSRSVGGVAVRRSRRCTSCGHRATSYETYLSPAGVLGLMNDLEAMAARMSGLAKRVARAVRADFGDGDAP